MTDDQWADLIELVNGRKKDHPSIGFIIDSPWLPNWYGITLLDYFTSDDLWINANLKAMVSFPEIMFLPGFWSEYGMCTEPSAFGAKCIFWKNEFPFAEKIIRSPGDVKNMKIPNPGTDGLLPFVLNRLVRAKPLIEKAGHGIRFSVSRGPLNIASFLMGTAELMTAMLTEPEAVHELLEIITEFLYRWHALQRENIPSIGGIMILDDIVGFIDEKEFLEFGFPYLKKLYSIPAEVKFFHNDADCTVSVRYYPEMGINLYNPGIHMTIRELIDATGNRLTILGNIPPRDVLAAGSPEDIEKHVRDLIAETPDLSRLILSCGGGMPPAVSSENIRAFIEAAKC
jgi:uroporphyrinogen decarboxylase